MHEDCIPFESVLEPENETIREINRINAEYAIRPVQWSKMPTLERQGWNNNYNPLEHGTYLTEVVRDFVGLSRDPMKTMLVETLCGRPDGFPPSRRIGNPHIEGIELYHAGAPYPGYFGPRSWSMAYTVVRIRVGRFAAVPLTFGELDGDYEGSPTVLIGWGRPSLQIGGAA